MTVIYVRYRCDKISSDVKIWLASWLYEIYESTSQRNNFVVFITHQTAIALELIQFYGHPTPRIHLSSLATNTIHTYSTCSTNNNMLTAWRGTNNE